MNNDENYQQPLCKVQKWELSAIVSVIVTLAAMLTN